ncbi:MAG: hypothetical protein WCG14_07415 [Chlamydiia bacterium]
MKLFLDKCMLLKPLSLFFSLVLFIGLGMTGFPQPMIDDLFFIGAGLNLAMGKSFSNPMLDRQNFPGTLYFVHPPLHSYALASWLKVFGVGTISILAFQIIMYVIICWSTILILKKYNSPRLLEWLVPLGVITSFLSLGLRPEPLSVALTMLGFALLECFGEEATILFSGFLLLFLGASVASRLSFFSAALALAGFFRLFQSGVSLIKLSKLAGSAMLTALFIFACLIHFQFRDFFEIYHFHAAGRVCGDKVGLLIRFICNFLGVTQWPIILFWLVSPLLLVQFLLKDKNTTRLCLFTFGAFLVLALIGGLGHGAIWYIVFVLFALTAAYARCSTPLRSVLAQALLATALILATSRYFVEIIGLTNQHIKTKETVKIIPYPTINHPVLIDAAAARYAYNYNLPNGVIDWNFAAPFPRELAIDDTLRQGDIFVLGPETIDILNEKKLIDIPLPKWNPLGSKRWSFHQHPRMVYVIYAKDCLNDKAKSKNSQKTKHLSEID